MDTIQMGIYDDREDMYRNNGDVAQVLQCLKMKSITAQQLKDNYIILTTDVGDMLKDHYDKKDVSDSVIRNLSKTRNTYLSKVVMYAQEQSDIDKRIKQIEKDFNNKASIEADSSMTK